MDTQKKMPDIVERLRKRRVSCWTHSTGDTPFFAGLAPDQECQEAADEIVRLRAALYECAVPAGEVVVTWDELGGSILAVTRQDADGRVLAMLAESSERAVPVVPQGWRLVPAEATEAMTKAAVVFANGNAVYKNVTAEALKIEESIYAETYSAMLAAAPALPSVEAQPAPRVAVALSESHAERDYPC